MAEPITIEDIYKLFQASQQAADRRIGEIERILAELAEADARRAAETERRTTEFAAETERRTAEFVAETERRNAEAERWEAQAKQETEQLKKIVAQTSREVANLTTRWGRFVENLVEPAVVSLFRQRGIEVHYTSNRVKSSQPGLAMEIDILAENQDELVLVEVKSRLAQDDVDAFIAKLRRFKQAFPPRYQNYHVYGAVAGIEILQGVDAYAYRRGLFVIKQAGESVVIANNAQFQPVSW